MQSGTHPTRWHTSPTLDDLRLDRLAFPHPGAAPLKSVLHDLGAVIGGKFPHPPGVRPR